MLCQNKVMVSLPKDLVEFADKLAIKRKTNRSEMIADVLNR